MNQTPQDPSELEKLQAAYERLEIQQHKLLQSHQQLVQRLDKLEKPTAHLSESRSSPPLKDFPDHLKTDAPTIKKKTVEWENKLGTLGFAWLGIFAFLTGAGLFIRHAYLEGWLGPWAVLGCGFITAIVLLVSGNVVAERHSRYKSWAHALMGGGVALLYFLTYASYHFKYFQQITHLNAFIDALLLMGIVVLAISLSLYRKSQTLASRAFVLGFFTSLLSTSFYSLTLFYNLFLSLGLLSVVFVTQWKLLLRMGVIGSWVLHGVWVYNNPDVVWGTHGLLLLYVLLYGVVVYRLKEKELPTGILNLMGYLSVFSLLYTQKEPWLWIVQAAYSLLALTLLYGDHKKNRLDPFYHGILGVLIPTGFYLCLIDQTQSIQAVFLAGTALVLYLAARALKQAPLLLTRTYDSISSVCLLSAMYMYLETPFLALGCIALSLFLLFQAHAKQKHLVYTAWLFHLNAVAVLIVKHYERISYLQDGLLTLGLYGGFIASTLIWKPFALSKKMKHGWLWPATAAILLYMDAALPASSLTIAFAVLGAVFIISGFWLHQSVVRYQGLAVLGSAGLHLLIKDLQGVDMLLRILSLFVVGIILMGLAWVYIRYEERTKETT